jgi:threonine aldolase
MIDRLAEDKANARRLAPILETLGFRLVFDKVSTNMVFVDILAGDAGPALREGVILQSISRTKAALRDSS